MKAEQQLWARYVVGHQLRSGRVRLGGGVKCSASEMRAERYSTPNTKHCKAVQAAMTEGTGPIAHRPYERFFDVPAPSLVLKQD